MDHPGEAHVRIRKGVVDRRSHERTDLRGDAARHFLWNEHVGQKGPMRSVLLRRAGWNDDGLVCFEKRLDFRVRHLAEKNGWWLHGSSRPR